MSENKDNIETGSRRIQFWGAAVIILMIVLMLMPWNLGDRAHSGSIAVIRGTTSDGRKLTSQDTQYALATLETLESLYVTVSGGPENPGGRLDLPLLTAIWGAERVAAFRSNPEAFALLVEESRKFGLGENPRTLGTLDIDSQNPDALGIFNNGFVYIRELHPLFGSALYQMSHMIFGGNQQIARITRPQIQSGSADGYMTQLLPASLPPLEQQAVYAALRDLLSVQAVASLASTAVKPSTVMIDQFIAQEQQTFTLNIASIDARPMIDLISVPTDAELKAHLEKYANVPANSVTPENPFGFGYLRGDAVKYQIMLINRNDVRAVVEAEKSAYEWEVEARMAYARDASIFKSLAATQPTTAPTSASAADPDSVPPFDQIKAGAIRIILDKATDARAQEIMRKIRTTMSLDHQAWLTSKNSGATTQPSSLGVDYESVEYLNRLAQSIQKESRFKLLPVVRSEQSKFMVSDELSIDPTISQLMHIFPENVARQLQLQTVALPASTYLVEYARPFMDKSMIGKAGSAVLEPFKPSEPLTDYSGDMIAYVRLTDTQASHPLTSIESIRSRLVNDVKRAEAQQAALEKANEAMRTIESTGKFDVPGATVSTVTVDPPAFGGKVPAELGLTDAAYEQFHQQLGQKLLGDPEGQPVAVLNVPLAQRVYVARRLSLKANWSSQEELNGNRVFFTGAMTDRMSQPRSGQNIWGLTDESIGSEWLSVDAILARNGWTSASGSETEE